MILFHGSTIEVVKPILNDLQKLVDFGKGFYTTSSEEQAKNWSKLKQQRIKSENAIVSVYKLDDFVFNDTNYKIKKFKNANEEWLNFVLKNRKKDIKHHYDMVIGAVANDTLYTTLNLYETGILTLNETIIRLKTHKLYDQISFHNELIIKELKFLKSKIIL